METRVEELEDKMGFVEIRLQKVVTRLDKIDWLDLEKINGAMERLPVSEEHPQPFPHLCTMRHDLIT